MLARTVGFFLLLFSHEVMFHCLQPRELQPARPPCPSPTPGAYSNPCPSSRWCHPTISSSVTPFSSRLQSLPASGSFPVSWLFASGGQSMGALAPVLPMNIQDWHLPVVFTKPLGRTNNINLTHFSAKQKKRGCFSNSLSEGSVPVNKVWEGPYKNKITG